eukprot:scaffold47304_cov75-Phaeocystis_antarctica.AAC.3
MLRGLRPQVAHRQHAIAVSGGDRDSYTLIALVLLRWYALGEPICRRVAPAGSSGGHSRSSLTHVARAAAGPRSADPRPGRLHQSAAPQGTTHLSRNHARSRGWSQRAGRAHAR